MDAIAEIAGSREREPRRAPAGLRGAHARGSLAITDGEQRVDVRRAAERQARAAAGGLAALRHRTRGSRRGGASRPPRDRGAVLGRAVARRRVRPAQLAIAPPTSLTYCVERLRRPCARHRGRVRRRRGGGAGHAADRGCRARRGRASPLAGGERPGRAVDHDERETALILYTSGTTGTSKGRSPLTPRRRSGRAGPARAARLPPGDRTLGVMPLYHTMGIHSLLATHLWRLFCTSPVRAEQGWGRSRTSA